MPLAKLTPQDTTILLRSFLGRIQNIRKAYFTCVSTTGESIAVVGVWDSTLPSSGTIFYCDSLQQSKKYPHKVAAKSVYAGDIVHPNYPAEMAEVLRDVLLGALPASEEEWTIPKGDIQRKDKPRKIKPARATKNTAK